MKKIKNILLPLATILLLASCINNTETSSTNNSTSSPTTTTTSSTNKKDRGVEEDTDYHIVIPSELYGNNNEAGYKVNHYLENYNGEYTDSVYSETKVGIIGEKTLAEAKEIEGFRAKTIEQKDIESDGSTSVDIYYELINYSIEVSTDTEESGVAGSGTYNRYNDTAYLLAKPYIGYKFLGWYIGEDLISTEENYSFKVDEDLSLLAKFTMIDDYIPFEFVSNFDECIIEGIIDENVKDLVIPEGVTEIYNSSFHSNLNLETVVLPSTLKKIDSYAFSSCYNLKTLTLKSKIEFEDNGFYECEKLLEIYDLAENHLDEYDGVYDLGCLPKYFKVIHTSVDDETIYSIDQDGFIFVNIENQVYLLGYNGDEDEVVLPSFTDKTYIIYKYAFYNKDFSLLTIPSCVTEIQSSAFKSRDDSYGIKHLYEIYNLSQILLSIGGSNNGYVARNAKVIHTSLDEEKCIFAYGDFIYKKEKGSEVDYARIIAYTGDKEVDKITIPAISDLKIIIDDSLFQTYRTLKEVVLNENVVEIGSYAFSNCNNITTINLENVETIKYNAFDSCSNLSEVNLNKCTSLGNYSFRKCILLKTANILECELIGRYAFDGCNSLSQVSFPKVKIIDQSAFFNCYSLCQVTLPSTLTTINSSAFGNCFRLIEVVNYSSKTIYVNSTNNGYVGKYAKNIINNISNSKIHNNNGFVTYEDGSDIILMAILDFDGDKLVIPSNITDMARCALFGYSKITELSIPVLNEVLAYYFVPEQYTSSYNTNLPNKLEKVYITGNIESIPQEAFKARSSIKEINIPVSVTSIAQDAFTEMSLESVYFDGGIGDWTHIVFANSGSNPLLCSNAAYLYNENGNVEYGNKKYSAITNVSLSEGVTEIGAYQFAGLPFETFNIPSTVTAIGEGAFSYCKNLTTINIPAGISTIPNLMFIGCTKLRSIDIPDSVTAIGEEAFNNTGLNEIILTDNITSVGSFAFADCISLIKATLPGIEEIPSGLFQNCINLQKINFNSEITIIGANAFNSCKSLKNIQIPNTLTNLGYQAFAYTNINSFTAPASLTSIGGKAFYRCSNLVELDLGDCTITEIPEFDGASIISGCRKLETVIIPDTVNSFYDSFVNDCPKITYNNGLYFGTKSYPYYYFCGLNIDSVVDFDDFHPDCRYIWDGAFFGCSNLKSVSIPDSIEHYSSIFNYSNMSLASLTLPRIDECLGDLFNSYGYYRSDKNGSVVGSLKTVTLTTNSNIPYEAFNNCQYVERIIFPSDVADIGQKAFKDCYSLKEINLPTSITSIYNQTFENCLSLRSITIPASLESFYYNSFSECINLVEVRNLSNVNIEKGSSANGYIGYYALAILDEDDPSIITVDDNGFVFVCTDNKGYLVGYEGDSTELILPDSFVYNNSTINEYEIYDRAFDDNRAIISVVISNSVKAIGYSAFEDCRNLESVIIGNGINKEFGDYSFSSCESLYEINYNGDMESFNLLMPDNNWLSYSSVSKIICTDGEIIID